MKKNNYVSICILLLSTIFFSKVSAQYYITSNSWEPHTDSNSACHYPVLHVTTNAYTPGLHIITYYGDGIWNTSPIYDGGGFGYANCFSYYSFPGTYTVKHILFNGSTPIDSVTEPHEFLYCNTVIIKCINDSLSTGIFDSTYGPFVQTPLKVEVSHSGIPIDTITITSGTYYNLHGLSGDIYAFRVLNLSTSLHLTFPLSGIIYDTIVPISNNHTVKFFGLRCSGTSGYDMAVNVTNYWSGVHAAYGEFYATNTSCTPMSGAVTVTFSPKFIYVDAVPSPSSISGNTLTWLLSNLSLKNSRHIEYYLTYNPATGMIPYGDTLHSIYSITPTTGDIDVSNNTEIIIDTDKHSHDPNDMFVSPTGYIIAGTKLKYTINFENTGNDTAFNVSVYDTVSDKVDIKSLDIIIASAVMNIAVLNKDGHNIIKFDFPNINLLDSSHHGLCNGSIVFTLNAKNDLFYGTTIFNHAGIFFDDNSVVMTDTVENIIKDPSGVAAINGSSKVELFPNPTDNLITIKDIDRIYTTAIITNAIGQEIMEQSLNTNKTTINVSRFSPGLYIVTLKGENGVTVKKFDKM